MDRSYQLRCLVAGCVWGGIAFFLGHRAFRGLILAGLVASPVIGLAVGKAVLRLKHSSTRAKAAAAGLTLYGGATLFGVAVGVGAVLTKAHNQNMEVLIEPVLSVLWGLTFTGYFVVLWPLAYVTQAWVLGAAPETAGS